MLFVTIEDDILNHGRTLGVVNHTCKIRIVATSPIQVVEVDICAKNDVLEVLMTKPRLT